MFLSLAFTTIATLITHCASQSAPTVTVINGTYAGIHDTSHNQDFFFGIPYAQPPVGDLRLRKPLSLNTSFTEPRQAIQYGYDCPQYPNPYGPAGNYSENCLTLNVGRPANAQNLPVAVWIYGGAFAAGSSSQSAYNLSNFLSAATAASKPLVVVSLNYRLNYFGFLAGSDLTNEGNTNLGLWDQRLALQWVKENIAAFGGDPSKVTIFGESAGAMSVAAHMLAFNGRNDNLFRGGIMESGAPTTGLYVSSTSSSAQSIYNDVLSKAGCSSAPNKLACLRSVSYDTLYSAMNNDSNIQSNTWLPVIDGGIIAQSPSKQIANGQYVKIPTIQGHNDDEGALFTTGTNSNSDSDTRSFITNSWSFFTSSQVDSIMTLYPNIPSDGVPYGRYGNQTFSDYGTQWRRVASIFGDVVFIGPCRIFCNISSFTAHQQVYRYRFNTTDPSFDPTWGATHGIEIGFVWNSPSLKTDTGMTTTVNFMSRAWASFVVDLNPNNHGLSGIPTWNTYSTSSSGQNLVIQNGTFSTEGDTFRLDGISLINNAVLKQV